MSKTPARLPISSLCTVFLVAVSLLALIPQSAHAVQSAGDGRSEPRSRGLDTDRSSTARSTRSSRWEPRWSWEARSPRCGGPGSPAIFTRNYLFAFDMETGVIDPNFVPVLDGAVEELTPGPDGTSVFVGGDFGTVNGRATRRSCA